MEALYWTTEKRVISTILSHEKNPRKISDAQQKQLKESIAKFNFVEIPAIDKDNTILAGHQRLKVMVLLGRGDEEIDVRVPNRKLTKEERDEYLIRSNKNVGEWDFDILKDFDKDILKNIGFTGQELDKIFKGDKEDDFNGDEEANRILTPISKYGDVYQLGRHRLMCGDASKKEDTDKLMGGGASGYGIHRSAIQRKLQRQRKEHIQYHQERRYERAGLQSNAACMVRQLQPHP